MSSKANKKAVKKATKEPKEPSALFPARPKNTGVGGDIRPTGRDLSRYVRWPKNVRLQRQKKILLQRLKVPPVINQFSKTLDKNQAAKAFQLFLKYKPETTEEKQKLIEATASAENKTGAAPVVLKYGLKHVTTLIEQKKAKLVLIAHDVDPIELVVWLPALCRKMGVPFAIIKGKGRLGTLTNKKSAAVVALTAVNKADEAELKTLQENFNAQFNENVEKRWGGGVMGLKTQVMLAKRQKQLEIEAAKKAEQLRR
jgi:large subunit ribosomal protein L7Ae